MKRNTILQLVCIILLLIAIIMSSVFIYFFPAKNYSCQLRADEISLYLGEEVSDKYSTYFVDDRTNKKIDSSLLDFTQAGDYVVDIPCQDKEYAILFHVIDQKQFQSSQQAKRDQRETKEMELSSLSKEQVVQELYRYIQEKDLHEGNFALAYENLITGDNLLINPDNMMFAASTYKLPLAMFYYDEIESGRRLLEDYLMYDYNSYDEQDPLHDIYPIGSYIKTEDLIYNSLVYSDNTSSLILFNNLGGFEVFKEVIKKYSEIEYTEEYLHNNEFTVRYLNDVLKYLHQSEEKYQDILELLKLVFPDDYLRRYIDVEAIQKFGEYDTAQNSTGIIYTKEPYAITIMCDTPMNGIDIIADISEIVYNYHLKAME